MTWSRTGKQQQSFRSLGGAARELARTLTPQEIFQGGIVNGQQLDPVSFLIHGLSVRFSPLDDEIRIRAAQDLFHFQRRGNEPVDVLVTRFETIRSRARAEGGGANLSVESNALVLLRAVGVNAEQFQRLTQPFGLRLPSTEQEFSDMVHQLRRMGHIIEHHPASITASLRAGGQASQSSHSYVSEPVHDPTNANVACIIMVVCRISRQWLGFPIIHAYASRRSDAHEPKH